MIHDKPLSKKALCDEQKGEKSVYVFRKIKTNKIKK